MIAAQRRAAAVELAQQRVEHVARSIGVGKQFSVRLFVQRDAKLAKPGCGGWRGKRTQDPANDGRAPAVEIAFGDLDVGDVAARAAADEDLRAWPARAFEDGDAGRWIRARRENRCRQSRGAGANYGDMKIRLRAQGSGLGVREPLSRARERDSEP